MARKIRFGLLALIGVALVSLGTGQAFASMDVSSPKYEDSDLDETPSLSPGQSAGEGSSTLSAGNSLWTRMKRNVSVGFFNFAVANMEQVHQAYSQVFNYSYFNFDYKIDRARKFSVRPVFQWATAGADDRGEYLAGKLELGDSFVNYIDYDFFKMPSVDMELAAQFRVYAPTSKMSMDQGLITRIRPWFILSKDVSRDVTIKLNFEPDYYIQSRTGSINPDTNKVGGNKNYGYESSLEVDYQFSRRFGAQVSVGQNEMYYYPVPAEGIYFIKHKHEVTTEASLTASFHKLFMVAGLSQTHGVAQPYNQFSLFRSDETDYYLLTSFRF